MKKNETVTLMCYACKNLIRVHGLFYPEYYARDFVSSEIYYGLNKCPHCKEIDDRLCEEIDEEFAYEIALLNKKGYQTEFSCASHSEEDPLMYVVFSYASDFEGISAPEHFYFETTDGGCIVLRNSEKESYAIAPMIPLTHENWEKIHKVHMDTFKKWVNDLPSLIDNADLNVKVKDINVTMKKIKPRKNDKKSKKVEA